MSKKWVLQKLKKNNVEKVSSYMPAAWGGARVTAAATPTAPARPTPPPPSVREVTGVRECERG